MLSGAVLVGTEVLMARYEGAVGKADLFGDQAAGAQEKKSDIKGPLNILLVGIDPRTPTARAAGRLDHGAARAGRDGPGLPLLAAPGPLRARSRRSSKADFPGEHRRRSTPRCRTAAGCRAATRTRARGFELLANDRAERDRHQALRRRRDHQLHRLPEDRRRDGRRRHVHRARGEVRAPAAGRQAPQGNPRGEGYVGPQAVYKKGNQHLERLAGAGLRPAALPEERRAGRRLRPAAPPAAVRQGDGRARRSAPTW